MLETEGVIPSHGMSRLAGYLFKLWITQKSSEIQKSTAEWSSDPAPVSVSSLPGELMGIRMVLDDLRVSLHFRHKKTRWFPAPCRPRNRSWAFASYQRPRWGPAHPAMLGQGNWALGLGSKTLKDRITPHVTNFFRLGLTIEEQEGKRKYKSDGAVMVGEFVCMYVCSCTVSEWECEW